MGAPQTQADRQLPLGNDVFLDHVGYFTADLDAAGAQLERLGFAVSPINLQQNADASGRLKPSGTSNRLAVLRRGFLEVLAATHDTPLGDQLKAALARYAGLHLIALSHADIPRQRERLWEFTPARLDEARQALDAISAQWGAALARLQRFVES